MRVTRKQNAVKALSESIKDERIGKIMGKTSNPRPVGDTEAMARGVRLRTSPQKLNQVASSIRGLPVERALNDLHFNRKRISQEVKKVLESAVANAENNHQLDIDALVVKEAYVGKNLVLKRFRPRARGRVGRLNKPFSNLTIVVAEQEAA